MELKRAGQKFKLEGNHSLPSVHRLSILLLSTSRMKGRREGSGQDGIQPIGSPLLDGVDCVHQTTRQRTKSVTCQEVRSDGGSQTG